VIGGLVHTDIAGPFQPSYDGYKYFAFFLDDHSNHVYPVLLKEKDGIAQAFEYYCEWLHRHTGHKVVAVRSDNGGEYRGEFDRYCQEKAITHQVTAPYSAFQNGRSERLNRTIKTLMATNMSMGVPYKLWTECFLYVVTMLNMTRSDAEKSLSALLSVEMAPYSNAAPNAPLLAPYGCLAIVHLPEQKRASDFHPRGMVGMFVGYDKSLRNKRVYVGGGKVVTTADVHIYPGVRGLKAIREVTSDSGVGLAADIPEEPFFHDGDELSYLIRNTATPLEEIRVTRGEARALGHCAPVVGRISVAPMSYQEIFVKTVEDAYAKPSLPGIIARISGLKLESTKDFPEDPRHDDDYEYETDSDSDTDEDAAPINGGVMHTSPPRAAHPAQTMTAVVGSYRISTSRQRRRAQVVCANPNSQRTQSCSWNRRNTCAQHVKNSRLPPLHPIRKWSS